jgi:peptide/nickel transport system permease protein
MDRTQHDLRRVLEINPQNRAARADLRRLDKAGRPSPPPRGTEDQQGSLDAGTITLDSYPATCVSHPATLDSRPVTSLQVPERRTQRLIQFARRAASSPALVTGCLIILVFLVVAIAAPILAPPEGGTPSIIPRDGYGAEPQPPGPGHPLGTMEEQGDVYYGLVWGARAAFRLGLIITLGRALIGILIGLTSGHWGGLTDSFLMRFTDAFLAFPIIAVVMVTVALYGHDLIVMPNGQRYPIPSGPRTEAVIILSLIAFGWMAYARLVRGNILSEREKEYMQAARSVGVTNRRMVFRHLLPNSTHGLPVLIASDIGMMVVWMAAFNFIGLIQGQKSMMVADWGQMLAFARDWIVGTPTNAFAYWYTFLPVSLAIVLFSIGWNLIGDGLRDLFDPRLRKGSSQVASE